jgi:hypothetical protein
MRKFVLLTILIISASYAKALVITTGNIMGSPFCGGATVNVPYTVDVPAGNGNVFTAQLSDKNGSFAVPVNIGTLAKKGSGTIVATIPLGTATGTKYRIRVISSNPAVIGSTNSSNLSINPQPTSVGVDAVTACSATVGWNTQSNAASFEIRYKLSTDAAYSSTTNVGLSTSYTYTGLKAGKMYDFQVRARCANGQTSTWKKVSGSTLATPVPTGGAVTGLTVTTATINWDDMSCASSYRVRYKESSSGVWQKYVNASSSTVTLTGLFPATLYDAQLATITGTNDSSSYSGTITWEQPYFKLEQGASTGDFTVFPSPSNGTFTVQITSSEAMNDAEVTVQNMYGQVVLKKSLTLSEGVNNELIVLERDQKGLFIVKVKAGSKIMQSAVTVQ